MPVRYTLFETSIGSMGLAWTEAGICCIQLPDATPKKTEARLRAKAPLAKKAPPPPAIVHATKAIVAHLKRDTQTFAGITLDEAGIAPFHRKVYAALRGVPSGETVSYGQLAKLAGSPNAVRAVGQAMAKNPFPVVVACHRVLAAGRKPGGFSAFGGADTKTRLLAREGFTLAPSGRAVPFDTEQATRTLSLTDPKLARLIEEVGPFRLALPPVSSTFEALARSIVYQQLTGKAAATIHARLCALFPGQRLLRAVDVAASSEFFLRTAGLSRNKALGLKDLAERQEAGTLPSFAQMRRMDDAQVIESLTKVRGIGPWSVEMLLIFRLGRSDVLPVSDYGVRKGFAKIYKMTDLPTPAQMIARGERWRPYRSVATWYLWRALDPQS